MLLEKIQSPADIKAMTSAELHTLAEEIRSALLQKLSAHGGHCGPNFGFVEGTIALHYVFNSPQDKIVFDVSHQSYPHKMLTGRAEAFLSEAHYDDVSGYTNPEESEHDFFNIGHTSTAVSLALGLSTARDLKGEDGKVIAVIGDGSLSGGEAFEALSNAGEYAKNFIVVANDNEMSIAENHGGLYEGLRRLRESNGEAKDNYFRSLGLDYLYVEDGNDVEALIAAFAKAKESVRPIVVHVHTNKGNGFDRAEQDKETWHFTAPFDLATGKAKGGSGTENYGALTGELLEDIAKNDPKAVVIAAGVPMAGGFGPERRQRVGKQYIDVGIAEEHAVALASGLAKGGAHPVFFTPSTFMQRTYDQISQDLCINRNSAVLISLAAGYDSMNDMTHLCIFDIPFFSSIPNLVLLEPTCKEEYEAMLRWAMAQEETPVVLRVGNAAASRPGIAFDTTYTAQPAYRIEKQGSRAAIVALGSFYGLGEQAAARLQESGIEATLINPRYFSGVDAAVLEGLKADHDVVITLENGILDGGFGEKIARFYGDSSVKVRNYGLRKEFFDRYDYAALAEEHHLTPSQIAADVLQMLG